MLSKFSKSYPDVLMAFLLGIWVYIFLVLVAPFDANPLNFTWRAKLMTGYAIITFLVYLLTAFLLQKAFPSRSTQPAVESLVFLALFAVLNFPPVFGYYKSEIVLGEYSLPRFALEVYTTVLLVIGPVMLIGRWILSRQLSQPGSKVTIYGENKTDVLRLDPADLLFVQTDRNYVEVHYLQGGTPQRKVMRSTLKNVAADLPFLTRTHRSYLVNLDHFSGWDRQGAILIGQASIPVSETYLKDLQMALPTRP